MEHDDIHGGQYLEGGENKFLRIYFYLSNGLQVLNEFRNLFLAILALYFTIKIDNLYILTAIFLVSVVLLTFIGFYQVHRGSRVKEWLTIKFSTHYGLRQFNYTKATYEELVKLRELLEKKNI